MKTYRVMVGMPCYGQVQALTAQSLWNLSAGNPYCFEVGDRRFEIELELSAMPIGPYVELHLVDLLERLAESGCDWMLRIDSDMAWTPEWVRHFFERHLEWVHQDLGQEIYEKWPMIHGGVYPRRQRTQNHTPIIQWRKHHHPDTDAGFVAKARESYIRGTSDSAARVGGGWCLYNKRCAELPPETWYVTKGLGEDYGGCDRVRKAGGSIFATWPKVGEAELGHVIQGLDYATIRDYLTAWAVATGQARAGVLAENAENGFSG